MPAHLDLTTLALALVLTGAMGFAVQRGATCTVAAVDEVVSLARCTRLLSMIEASLWVAGGLALALTLQLTTFTPSGNALSWRIVLGGALLGSGAYINKGCVFGAIARLSNGELAYLATPLGYFIGCRAVHGLALPHTTATFDSPLFVSPGVAAGVIAVFLFMRVGRALWRRRTLALRALAAKIWEPHAATSVIGICFIVLLVLVGGSWAYTDVLDEFARGQVMPLDWRVGLLLALYGGGLLGGYTAGRLQGARFRPAQALACLAGGILMGLGSLLIPGSNDGLILLGMPLLLPHAWLAFGTMFLTIAILMQGQRIAAWWRVRPA
ncbi:MAG: YeeE/YedE thiosulfate transporter family protein [Pseudomonadota bacterium]